MGALEYRGPRGSSPPGQTVAWRSYAEGLVANAITKAQADAQIASAFQGFITPAQADSGFTGLVTPQAVSTAVSTLLPSSQRNANNGLAGLNAQGMVDSSRLPPSGSQRFPRSYWSPSSYHSGVRTVSNNTESTLVTMTMADPGYAYRLMGFGYWEAHSQGGSTFPEIVFRINTISGPIVARGYGRSSSSWGELTVTPCADHPPQTGSTIIYARLSRAVQTQYVSATDWRCHMSVFPVQAN